MFGLSAFAQAPFAALGSKITLASVEESASAAFSLLSQAVFAAARSESASTNGAFGNQNNVFNNYFSDSVSGSSALLSQAVLAAARSDAASGTNSFAAQANFVASLAESGNTLAAQIGRAV